MTEQEWSASEDPAAMLSWLTAPYPADDPTVRASRKVERPPHPGARKLRLFACACCRQVWHLLSDERSRDAVEVAERFADGLATAGELRTAFDLAHRAANDSNAGYFTPAWLSFYASDDRPELAQESLRNLLFVATSVQIARTKARLAALLREVAGNPFRPVPPLHHHELGSSPWITPQVLSLAQAAYDERPGRECGNCKGIGTIGGYFGDNITAPVDYDEYDCPDCGGTGRTDDGTLDPFLLAVLSDALEEAGCTDEAILSHLRSLGPHVRGCHVLDNLLDKERSCTESFVLSY